MPNIDLPDDLHDRLRTVGNRDYGGASLAETLGHLAWSRVENPPVDRLEPSAAKPGRRRAEAASQGAWSTIGRGVRGQA
jgi:hypothetical protein